MSKKLKIISCLAMTLLLLNGCDTIKEDSRSTKEQIISKVDKDIDNSKKDKIIISNSNSKMSSELINIIETTGKEKLSMSKEDRYDLRSELFSSMSSEQVHAFDNSYAVLTSVIADDRYKDLFDKNNRRWDAYDDNNLYDITDIMTSIYNVAKNQKFKNDISRISALCSYGLNNRDVVALIDARRIIRDINYHVFQVPYFKKGDAIVEINEDDYSIYYGASETLEGNSYRTIGLYKYN